MSGEGADFAAWLRGLTGERGWLQRDLAAAVGVTQQTASRWLLGQTLPNAAHAQGLAHALGLTTDEVLERLAATPSTPTPGQEPGPGGPHGETSELSALRARVARLEAELARARRA